MISWFLESVTGFIVEVIGLIGYPGIFVLMALEGSFIPLPSEIILPFSGFLASQGEFSVWMIAFLGALGNIVGTLFSYAAARLLGLPFLYRYGKYLLVTRADIDRSTELFRKHGASVIFLTRLLPGVRGFLPIAAGVARMSLVPFVLYVFVGSFLWSLFLTYLGFVVGENWDIIGVYVSQVAELLLLGALVLLAWWVWRRILAVRREQASQKP